MRWYLEYPTYGLLENELGHIPDEVAFVWGHTHKPFEDLMLLDIEKYRRPVRVFNTGGWVVDQSRLASTQGAAVVVIDSDINLASLRLFNNTLSGADSAVRVNGCRQEANPLVASLRAQIESSSEFWTQFSLDVHDSLELRAELMSRKYFDPKKGQTKAEEIA